jgi:hypothetical protein
MRARAISAAVLETIVIPASGETAFSMVERLRSIEATIGRSSCKLATARKGAIRATKPLLTKCRRRVVR